jgi:hypothetical protein
MHSEFWSGYPKGRYFEISAPRWDDNIRIKINEGVDFICYSG